MTVCFISKESLPHYYGGIGVQFQMTMEDLRSEGHSVIFLTRRPARDDTDWQATYYEGIAIEFVQEPDDHSAGLYALAYSEAVADVIDRISAERTIDLIVAADFEGEAFSPLFRRGGFGPRIPILIAIGGPSAEILHYNGRVPTTAERLISSMEDASIEFCDARVSPTRIAWNLIAARLNREDLACEVVPNGVPWRTLRASSLDRRTIPGLIVYIGRLQRVKGVDLLMEAFRQIVGAGLDCRLVLLGRDLKWSEYGDRTFTEHWRDVLPPAILDRIRFAGAVSREEVAAELNSAYVAVFASRWETFGIAALEACSVGVPPIVTRETGLSEIVGQNYPWTFSIEGGAAALAEQLRNALTRPELREALSQTVRARAAQLQRESKEKWLRIVEQTVASCRTASSSGRPSLGRVLTALTATLKETRTLLATDQNELRSRDSLLAKAETAIIDRDNHIRRLVKEVDGRDGRLLARDQEVMHLAAEVHERDARILDRDERITELTAQVTARDRQIAERDRRIEEMTLQVKSRDAEIIRRDSQISNLEEALRRFRKHY